MESASRLCTMFPEQHLFHCTSTDTFMNSILQFAVSKGLEGPKLEAGKVDEQKLVLDFLQSQAEQLLLVFDDVRCDEVLDFLPKIWRHSVLATSNMELLSQQFDLRIRTHNLATVD